MSVSNGIAVRCGSLYLHVRTQPLDLQQFIDGRKAVRDQPEVKYRVLLPK